MKILLAPDKFKGTLSAIEAAEAMKDGLEPAFPDAVITTSPVADGGDGTLEIILNAMGGQNIAKTVTGPYGKPVKAYYGILPEKKGQPKTAIIEMAQASGLSLTGRLKKATAATSFGTGELIKAALNSGCRKIVVGLGGSATSDGGMGALTALGVRFHNRLGGMIKIGSGQALALVRDFDDKLLDMRLKNSEILLATDVDNPFYGQGGAIKTYARQKGANPAQRQLLEAGLRHFADLVLRERKIDLQKVSGSGAAGGLAGGLYAFLPNSKIVSGFDIVAGLTGLERKIKASDLIITGEGKIDQQTLHGKAPYGVLGLANKNHKITIAVGGILGKDWENTLGSGKFKEIYTITGQRAFFKEVIRVDKPFQHKLKIDLGLDNISRSTSKKRTAELLKYFTPLFVKDFFKPV